MERSNIYEYISYIIICNLAIVAWCPDDFNKLLHVLIMNNL